MNSGREVILALRIAGYLDAALVTKEVNAVDRMVAIVYKLAYRPR